ncbi:MAG: family 43 glycosylhydrolase [Bacteroidaceae bacterium]|nr:family 43 glycosylhydrolase [Bacteroidaceae bacterium]MBQ6750415.1 family 43 glycosylhydrolase [Bacteroidaceae bacterium]
METLLLGKNKRAHLLFILSFVICHLSFSPARARLLFILSFIICHLSFSPARAQVGAPYIHDPSTIAECDGKYYTFGTGGGGLISDDGWTWHSGAERPGGGAAPDVLKIGNRYLVIYGATGGGLGGGHNGRILTMWNKTLDPQSPDFRYTEPIEVAASDGMEDNDAIDPSLLLDPTTGRLWASYGTYFGTIRLIELDPKTGERVRGNKEKDIAIDCEATDLIYRDGWYYLLGTHGTCCDGVNSTYNIVVGRSKKVTGPYLDNVGRDMFHGGGKMVIAAGDRVCGPGHFGRTVIDEGVEIMSCHYEADFDQGGRSVLGIRPLLWKNGWPVAGDRFKGGTFEIESERRGYALELAVDFVRMPQERQAWFRREEQQKPPVPVANQSLADVLSTWPTGNIPVRAGDYMFRPHQRWTLTPVPEAGGYLGGPYYKITIADTDRALAATANLELTTVPAFSGSDEQLWCVQQLIDGTFRLMPKAIPGRPGINTRYCLYSAGDSTPTLAEYDFSTDNSKWNFRNH